MSVATSPELRLPNRLTPLRYLRALLLARPWLAVAASLSGALWLVPGALLPLVVGRAVEAISGDGALLGPIGLIVVLGVAQTIFGAAMIFTSHGMWIHGAAATQRTISAHTARLGASLRTQALTGDVMAMSSSDMNHIGNFFEVQGRLFGSVVAFLTVGIALLDTSPLLGSVALVGVPLAVLGIGPLIAPLQRRKGVQREERSEVNSLGSDIVSGLRILRGIGGERQFLRRFSDASQRVRRAGVEVARNESWLVGAEILLPGLVTVTITWLGARLAMAGTISVGELVAFYGASAFLVVPVSTATEATGALSSALVAAKKACGILRLRPLLAAPESPVALPAGPLELHDTESGITAVAGKLTVIDAGSDAEALAARLARFADPASGQRVLASGVPADRVALAELRTRVVYAHNQDMWFSGILREELAPDGESATERASGNRNMPGQGDASNARSEGTASRGQGSGQGERELGREESPGHAMACARSQTGTDIETALWAADADDIVEGLPRGLDELIGERGREVSGGQRQRLNLARALAVGTDTLLLDEPTSAVDAHTEARITKRVAELRRGRTTVVFSESPLWTAVADEVISCP